jgi:hypothetical protein
MSIRPVIPEGKSGDLWEECVAILRFGRNDLQPEDPTGIAWLLRFQLARHYLGQLVLHTADQNPDRLAALAWWVAERVATAATESIVEEEEADERVTERLQALLKRSIFPQAAASDSMWDLLRPAATGSPFAFGTMEIRALWGTSLLSAAARYGEGEGPSVPTAYQEDLAVALVGSCLVGFPPPGSCGPPSVLAFNTPIESSAGFWLTRVEETESHAFLVEIVNIRRGIVDAAALVESLRHVTEASAPEQLLLCHTFRAACVLGRIDPVTVWNMLSNRARTRSCFSVLDQSLLHVLCLGLLELQRREAGRWHWALPPLFGSLAGELDIEQERRRVLALLTVHSCIVGGTVSAVQRLLSSARAHEFVGHLEQWKDQLKKLQAVGPPVVGASLRDILAVLPTIPVSENPDKQKQP